MIRSLSKKDLPAIVRIQASAYSHELIESSESLESKLCASPETCFVKILNGEIAAYCIAYPYPQNMVPDLNSVLKDGSSSKNIFLHDLAVLPAYRGEGVATAMLSHLFAMAKSQGFSSVTLVAVQNSISFWKRFGFEIIEDSCDSCGYGDGALLMNCDYIPSA